MTTTTRTVSLSVDVEDDMDLPHVMEIVARHACGLILEGVDARIYAYTTETEEESDG